MEGLRSFFRDTVIYGVAAVLPRVINLLLVIMHTTVFLPEQYSDNTTWYVYAAYFNVILTLGVETAFFRFYTSEKDKSGVIATSFILLVISSLSFLQIILGFAKPISAFFGYEDMAFTKILGLTVVLDTLAVVPFAFMRVQGKALKYMLIKLINVFLIVILNFVLLIQIPQFGQAFTLNIFILDIQIQTQPQVVYIFFANLLASLLTLGMVLPDILRFKITFNKEIAAKLLQYGLPIMIGGIAYITNENLDKLAIEKISGKEANGIYAACYKLGVFMTLYITAFRLGAEPFFFNNARAADAKEKYSFIMKWFVILGTVFMLGITAFLDFFASLLIKDTIYFSGLVIVPVILLANLFSGIYNNLSVWYKLTDRTRMGMYISILGAIITIVFLYLLIPHYGYMGAAYTTLIAYGSMTVISWIAGQKYYPVPYPVSRIGFYIAVSGVLSALSYKLFRDHFWINAAMILFYLLLIGYLEKLPVLWRNLKVRS